MNIYQFKIQVYGIFKTIFGSNNVRNWYLKRCIETYKKRGVIFIHIPKAGGTSVAYALFGKRAGHFYAEEVLNFTGEKVFNRAYSFAIVRNPFDRLVSAYHFARQGGSKEGAIKNKKFYSNEMFNDFPSFVTQWLVHQDPLSIEIVFRPQYLFITNQQEQVIVNYIGKLEEIQKSLTIVEQAIGVSFPIEWKNKSSHLNYKTYYNAELEELVYNYYKLDFELLGYNNRIGDL